MPEAEPSNNLYIGNLYFEVSEETLKKEFEKYGPVERAKVVYDARGLSKGYGYIQYGTKEEAIEARDRLNGKVLEGRRLSVQYALKSEPRPRSSQMSFSAPKNEPSKTLFIGNMSYDMSDKDLNDLFKGVKNVLDVRVAIDRRTGQPRGFAHADFLDVASAQAAAEYLANKEFYGRNLRVDYSGQSNKPPRENGRDGGRTSGTSY